jgi:hypothetical protein
MLSKRLNQALASAQGTADNFYLRRMSRALDEVEQAAPGNPTLEAYAKELGELLDAPNFELDSHRTNKFAQALGEAHFWLLCHKAGVALDRIPEQGKQGKKTPDFQSSTMPGKLHFEVKTLSVVGGDAGVSDAIVSAMDAQLDIERQRSAGRPVAMGVTEIAPYGQKRPGQGALLHATRVLIDKIRQNVKSDQFAGPNTFLVLNLSMLGPWEDTLRVLRPSYPQTEGLFPTSVTGQLWAAAFGRPEMIVQNEPEFEGKPCVEGDLDRLGVLWESPEIKGLVFVVHPLNEPAMVWALVRDFEQMNDHDQEVLEELMKLVGHDWNDAFDWNGFRLQWPPLPDLPPPPAA